MGRWHIVSSVMYTPCGVPEKKSYSCSLTEDIGISLGWEGNSVRPKYSKKCMKFTLPLIALMLMCDDMR